MGVEKGGRGPWSPWFVKFDIKILVEKRFSELAKLPRPGKNPPNAHGCHVNDYAFYFERLRGVSC